MKWLKLDCDYRNDPKIQALARKMGGQAACGFWTLLLGFVGAHGGGTCKVKIDPDGEYTELYLASWLFSTPLKVRSSLDYAGHLSLIDRTSWEQESTIYIPNMLKRVDDYTRKSGHASDKVQKKTPLDKDIEVEEDKEKEKERLRRLQAGFEKLWEKYPAKDGRKEAEKRFKSSVKTDEDLLAIQKALQNYLVHLATTDWKRPKNGSTWFNNWQDWVHWREPERPDPANRPPDPSIGFFVSTAIEMSGVPYCVTEGDRDWMAKLRDACEMPRDSVADPHGWNQAVLNYWASPIGSPKLEDLCQRYSVFVRSAVDDYNKPVKKRGQHGTRSRDSDGPARTAAEAVGRPAGPDYKPKQ